MKMANKSEDDVSLQTSWPLSLFTAVQILIVYRWDFHRAYDFYHDFRCSTYHFVKRFMFQ